MQKINYGLQCEQLLAEIKNSGCRPSLLLHVCCAPCSSYVIEYLEEYFDITLFFYNPNITDSAEFAYRLDELSRFVNERVGRECGLIVDEYDPDSFFALVRGLEGEKEGGARCEVCYRQRLDRTARRAASDGYDFFATTLTVSPYKNATLLSEIGLELEKECDVRYLVSDFKKKGGYLRSIELSSVYGLYRQDFCGCVFSMEQARARRQSSASEK